MHTFVTAQRVCHNKKFVVTKIILVAALANDSSVQLFYQFWLSQPTCIFVFLSFYISQILRIVFNIFLFVYLGCCLIIWNSAWWWSHPLSFTHSYHFWLSWPMVKITGELVKPDVWFLQFWMWIQWAVAVWLHLRTSSHHASHHPLHLEKD